MRILLSILIVLPLIASDTKYDGVKTFKSLRHQTKCDICQMIKNGAAIDSKMETTQLIESDKGKTIIEIINGGINDHNQVELAVTESEVLKGECISTKSNNFLVPLALFKLWCKEFEKEQKEAVR